MPEILSEVGAALPPSAGLGSLDIPGGAAGGNGDFTMDYQYYFAHFIWPAVHHGVRSGQKKRVLELGLLAVMLIETCAYGVFGLCMNGTVNRKDYYSDQKAVSELKAQIEEREGGEFFTGQSWKNAGGGMMSPGIICRECPFSSTVNAGVDHLAKRLGFYSVTNKYSYQGRRRRRMLS